MVLGRTDQLDCADHEIRLQEARLKRVGRAQHVRRALNYCSLSTRNIPHITCQSHRNAREPQTKPMKSVTIHCMLLLCECTLCTLE